MHATATRFPRQGASISADSIIRLAAWAMLLLFAAYVAADICAYTRNIDMLAMTGQGGM
jgi:hypothetical protein